MSLSYVQQHIPNVISQMEFAEGKMYGDLTPTFVGVERLFPIDPQLKREVILRRFAKTKSQQISR